MAKKQGKNASRPSAQRYKAEKRSEFNRLRKQEKHKRKVEKQAKRKEEQKLRKLQTDAVKRHQGESDGPVNTEVV